MSETIAQRIERLENYVLYPDHKADPTGRDRDHALLELAALRLQHPEVDPQGMKWAGAKLQELLDNYYAAKKDIALDKGDPRSASSRNGRDPWTGLRWPAAILFEYKTLPRSGKLQGEPIAHRVAERLRERGFSGGASQVKAMYYEAKKDQISTQELSVFYERHRLSKK